MPIGKNDYDPDSHLYRPTPFRQFCLEDARPLPPNPINNNRVKIYDFTVDSNNKLFLNFTWELPEATYGRVTAYQVRVLHVPVSSSDVPASSNIIVEKEFSS